MPTSLKNTQLQIRICEKEKRLLQRRAAQAGMDLTTYVLHKVLPPAQTTFRELADATAGADAPFAFAELNRFLSGLNAAELGQAVAHSPGSTLTPYLMNYLAATVEFACARRHVKLPAWTRAVPPLPDPVFGSALKSLRLHLLTHSPPPFRFRNLFIDSTLSDGV